MRKKRKREKIDFKREKEELSMCKRSEILSKTLFALDNLETQFESLENQHICCGSSGLIANA